MQATEGAAVEEPGRVEIDQVVHLWVKPRQQRQAHHEQAEQDPAQANPADAGVTCGGKVPPPDDKDHQAAEVEIVRHRASDQTLLHLRAEDLMADVDHDGRIEREAALPEHQRD
ncbi:hypothetical protein AYO44_07695 [Planctomycetaceae bacterium SCGC AG-212-F19]|nr:hypothetical protein AYO44_07695 [Planctomycetaceae bacterium SCGC AG-212-F19]